MAKMGIREYARHRGCHHVSVLNAIKAGKLSKAVTVDDEGNKRINSTIADQEWPQGVQELFRSPNSKPRLVDAMPDEEPGQPKRSVGESMATARAIREGYMAKIAKLEFEERSRALIPADQIEQKWVTLGNIVRTKLLGVPFKMKQRYPDMEIERYNAMDALIREALEDLADGKN